MILYVNSPGGTTTGGEAFMKACARSPRRSRWWRNLARSRRRPATSSGWPADHIVARGNSITGSVGVIVQWPEFVQLLDKVGVKVNEVKSGPLKASPSPFEPLNEGGRKVAEGMVNDGFKWFLGLVEDAPRHQGRRMFRA